MECTTGNCIGGVNTKLPLAGFDYTVVAGVPTKPEDFTRVFDEEYLELMRMFEIVDSHDVSLFEFNLNKSKLDKEVGKPEAIKQAKVDARAARVANLAAFYAENEKNEISPFEDAVEVDG